MVKDATAMWTSMSQLVPMNWAEETYELPNDDEWEKKCARSQKILLGIVAILYTICIPFFIYNTSSLSIKKKIQKKERGS